MNLRRTSMHFQIKRLTNFLGLSLIGGIKCLTAPTSKFAKRYYMFVHQPFEWTPLCEDLDQLRPDCTMNMGQCFNWKRLADPAAKSWVGVLANQPLLVRQRDSSTEYINLFTNTALDVTAAYLKHYFQLQHDLSKLYSTWSSGCHRMEAVTARLQGVRVVRQDPWECLISFICSSNNNIARITQMLDKLRRKYGHKLCTVSRVRVTPDSAIDECNVLPIDVTDASAACEADGAPSKHVWVVQYPTSESDTASSSTTSGATPALESFELYSFPTVTSLAEASEEDLRGLGMGYRAKFIVGSAKLVQAKCAERRGVGVKSEVAGTGGTDDDRGELWFEYLRSLAADAAQGCEKDVHQSADPAIRKIKREPDLRICSESGGSSEEVQGSREESRLKVQALLMELPGVGRKVADCVALFSLDQTAAVPVDTHVWNIAIRDYAPHLRSAVAVVKAEPTGSTPLRATTDAEEGAATPSNEGVIAMKGRGKRKLVQEKPPAVSIKQEVGVLSAAADELGSPGTGTPGVGSIETMSLTPAVYEMVGQVFRDHFGPYAGWAHSVLFAAELPQFRVLLSESMQKEMTDFSALQRSAKKEKRDEKAKKSAAGGEVALTEEFEDEIITFSPAPKKVVKSRKS